MPQSTPDQVTLRLTFKVKQMHAVTGTDSWNRHQQRHNSSPNGCQQRMSENASPSTPPPLVAEGAAICMAFFTRGDERPGEINAWPRCGRLLLEHCEIPRSDRKKKRLGVEDCFLGMPACISTKALPWQGVWLPSTGGPAVAHWPTHTAKQPEVRGLRLQEWTWTTTPQPLICGDKKNKTSTSSCSDCLQPKLHLLCMVWLRFKLYIHSLCTRLIYSEMELLAKGLKAKWGYVRQPVFPVVFVGFTQTSTHATILSAHWFPSEFTDRSYLPAQSFWKLFGEKQRFNNFFLQIYSFLPLYTHTHAWLHIPLIHYTSPNQLYLAIQVSSMDISGRRLTSSPWYSSWYLCPRIFLHYLFINLMLYYLIIIL